MSIWAPKPDVFVNMHVYMLVDKGLRVGFRECCACVCCFWSLGLKWTLGTQLVLTPRSPRKAEVDSSVLLTPGRSLS